MRVLILCGLILVVGSGCARSVTSIQKVTPNHNPYTLNISNDWWWESFPHRRTIQSIVGIEECCVRYSDFFNAVDSLYFYVSTPMFIDVRVQVLVIYSDTRFEQWTGITSGQSKVSLPVFPDWQEVALVTSRELQVMPVWRDSGIRGTWVMARPWPVIRSAHPRIIDL